MDQKVICFFMGAAGVLAFLKRWQECIPLSELSIALKTHPCSFYLLGIAQLNCNDPLGAAKSLQFSIKLCNTKKYNYPFNWTTQQLLVVMNKNLNIARSRITLQTKKAIPSPNHVLQIVCKENQTEILQWLIRNSMITKEEIARSFWLLSHSSRLQFYQESIMNREHQSFITFKTLLQKPKDSLHSNKSPFLKLRRFHKHSTVVSLIGLFLHGTKDTRRLHGQIIKQFETEKQTKRETKLMKNVSLWLGLGIVVGVAFIWSSFSEKNKRKQGGQQFTRISSKVRVPPKPPKVSFWNF